jgi:hypothetical protein
MRFWAITESYLVINELHARARVFYMLYAGIGAGRSYKWPKHCNQEMETSMKNNQLTPYTIPADVLELLGPLPVLSKHEATAYLALLGRFARMYKPRDLVEWGYVKDLLDHWLETQWSRRVKACIREPVERRCRELSARTEAWPDRGERGQDGRNAAEAVETGRRQIDSKTDNMGAELDEWEPKELELDMMRRWMAKYELLEWAQRLSEEKFDATLGRMEEYRAGLGARLRASSDEVLEARAQAGLPPACSISEYAAALAYRSRIEPPAQKAAECAETTTSEEVPMPPPSVTTKATEGSAVSYQEPVAAAADVKKDG